jgi:hypothetical protein
VTACIEQLISGMRKTEYIRKLADLILLLSLKRFSRRRSGGGPYSISVNTPKDDLHYEKAQRTSMVIEEIPTVYCILADAILGDFQR